MIEFEITNEMRRNAEERLYQMVETAEPIFNELFPDLDYVDDFWQNENITEIKFLLDVVEKVVREKGYENYGVLYKVLKWDFEWLADEEFRKDTFEILRSLDEEEKENFNIKTVIEEIPPKNRANNVSRIPEGHLHKRRHRDRG